jgi:hypothetical protein
MRSWQLAMVMVGGALLFTARPAQAQRVWVGPGGPVMVAPGWQTAPVWSGSPRWGRPRPYRYRGGWYGYRSGWYGPRGGWYASARGPWGGRAAVRRW